MKVRLTSVRRMRRRRTRRRWCSAGVKQGHDWMFVSMKMKGPWLAAEPPQSQHFSGLLPKSLSGRRRRTNEAALGGE